MRVCPLLPIVALLAAGCGGSGQFVRSNPALRGRVAVRVAWPRSASRLIPPAAQSVQVQVLQGATVVNTALLTASAQSKVFSEVPVGSVTVKAVAYPTVGGTGTAVASAQTTATVAEGATANVDLTMASAIDHLTISPNPFNLALTGVFTRQATVTAYDASGAIVPMAAGDVAYTVGGPGIDVFAISASGLVTGLAVGSATLTATDSVSGKTATAPVTVTLN